MDAKDVRKRLDDALREVLESDRHLFETDASERSIAARLECAGYRNESDQSLAVPDVIVHRRGPTGPNLLVLELKKTTNPDKGDCDRVRLLAFRKQIGYCYGALIVCETRKGREPEMRAQWLDE